MNVPKIDVHVHATMWPEISMPRPNGEGYPSLAQVVEKYDAWGIEKGFLLPEVNNECCTTGQTSEMACMMARSMPDRFGWFCNIDPHMGSNNPHTDFVPFLEHYKKLGAKGVGEMSTNLPFDDPLLDNLLRCCAECDMPIIIHLSPVIGGDYGIYDELGLPRMEKMLKKYPKLRIIGHSQLFWAEISGDNNEEVRHYYPKTKVTEGRLHQLLRTYPNLFCDLSAGSGENALTRDEDHAFRFIEEFHDRLCFGTDVCGPSQVMGLSHWLDEKHDAGCISDDNYYAICRGNAIRELKLED